MHCAFDGLRLKAGRSGQDCRFGGACVLMPLTASRRVFCRACVCRSCQFCLSYTCLMPASVPPPPLCLVHCQSTYLRTFPVERHANGVQSSAHISAALAPHQPASGVTGRVPASRAVFGCCCRVSLPGFIVRGVSRDRLVVLYRSRLL